MMKRLLQIIFAVIVVTQTATVATAEEKKAPLKYVDALDFRMINKGFDDTETPYTRLPKYLQDSVRADLWNRQQCSSGLGIRFSTNSTRVGVRYTLLWDTHMFHMADTGLKGKDLYILTDDGRWENVNTNRPIENDKKEYNLNNLINSTRNKDNLENLNKKIMIFNEFSNAVDRMIAGEYLDTELEGQQISHQMLQYIHENKTGELLKLSIRMGAILADASENDIERLSKFADKIGLAFQIKDDILSEEGNPDVTGKPVGNDKEHNKCTYVSVFGIEGAKKELEKITNEAVEILEYYGDKAEFLKQLAIYIKNRNK